MITQDPSESLQIILECNRSVTYGTGVVIITIIKAPIQAIASTHRPRLTGCLMTMIQQHAQYASSRIHASMHVSQPSISVCIFTASARGSIKNM
jgi:hypothetical protein